MAEEIEIARARLERAHEHLEKFKRESSDFLASGAYRVLHKKRAEGKETFDLYVFQVLKPVPLGLRITFGECINQLRAPCDGLMAALGRKHVGVQKHTPSFPVFDRPRALPTGGSKGFEGWLRQDAPSLPPAIVAVLEQLQPYNGPSGVMEHPLMILHSFWNQDKHDVPLQVAGAHVGSTITFNGGMSVTSTSPDFAADPAYAKRSAFFDAQYARMCKTVLNLTARGTDGRASAGPISVFAGGIIEDGMEVVRVKRGLGLKVYDLDAPVSVELVVDRSAPAARGRFAVEFLEQMCGFVDKSIVEALESFF